MNQQWTVNTNPQHGADGKLLRCETHFTPWYFEVKAVPELTRAKRCGRYCRIVMRMQQNRSVPCVNGVNLPQRSSKLVDTFRGVELPVIGPVFPFVACMLRRCPNRRVQMTEKILDHVEGWAPGNPASYHP